MPEAAVDKKYFWQWFEHRGFFRQSTDAQAISSQSAEGPLVGYIGFDPTADSFHAGHLIPLMALVHFQQAGHRPIALLGGGTAMIGDPTGKTAMRTLLAEETLEHNLNALAKQLSTLLDFNAEQGAILANNADWLRKLDYLTFLREVGRHFSVNRMLTFETFKARMEDSGLSFLEFNYPLLQAYDFVQLSRRHGCQLQLGGDDQWANILCGVDLARRMDQKTVYGWTFPLLETASGRKMGKTEQGTIWLDENKTSPFDYHQYWLNTADADVLMFLRLFTLLPDEEIAELSQLQGADIRKAKAVLANAATTVVHGEEAAASAERGAKALFAGALSSANPDQASSSWEDMPHTKIPRTQLKAGWGLLDALKASDMVNSLSHARRLVEQGGVSVNGKRVESADLMLIEVHLNTLPSAASQQTEGLMLQVGKKKRHQIIVID